MRTAGSQQKLTVQLGRGPENAFYEFLGVSNSFPTAAYAQTVVNYHHEVTSIPLGEVSWEKRSGGPTDELHPFTKSSETGLGYTTDSTALPRSIRQIAICVYY